ncbi:MAG: DUF1573 domain-containing protein [Candidatus Caldatribacteriota bacterium]|nr:DUF1573 domain-containing protein [Candidatus Caldatribacteriota bacterium]
MVRKNKIIIILISIVVIIGAFLIFNNIQNKSSQPPSISFSEEEWDFGNIKEDERPSHIFTVTNTGGEELIISRVRASCGCTATMLSSDHILPGKSVELKTTFNPSGYKNLVKKSIYIESNDPELSRLKIAVIANVEAIPAPQAYISNSQWNLDLISQGDFPEFNFTVENKGELELIIEKINASEYIQYNVSLPLSIPVGEKKDIRFSYDSSKHEIGEIKESIRIYCNDPRRKAFSLRISGYIKEETEPRVSISPTVAKFNLASDLDDKLVNQFTLENSGKKSVRIVSVETSADYLIPLRSEFDLRTKEKENLQIVFLKDKFQDKKLKEKTEEYFYLTIAIPIEINK